LIGHGRHPDQQSYETALGRAVQRRSNVCVLCVERVTVSAKTLQTSGYVLSALLRFHHMTGNFCDDRLVVLIFISLFLAVAQERTNL